MGKLRSGFATSTSRYCTGTRTVILAVVLAVLPAVAVAQVAAPAGPPPIDRIETPADAASPEPDPAWLEPVPPEQVVAIPPALLERLQREVVEPTHSRNERLDLLVNLLLGPQGLSLQYDATRTRTLAQSVADRKINCLSFSLLFVALARLAGINAHVQETDHVLGWSQGGVLYGNGHVNVSVRISGTHKIVDIDRSVVAVHGETRRVSDDRALSHFYNNRGAELMREGELGAARRNFEMALRITPEFISAWNNLGVLNMREGMLAKAERAYRKALDEDSRHAPALSNMVNLYRQMGNERKRKAFEERLFLVQSRDPFQQVILAMGYEQEGDYAQALDYYRRALRLRADWHYIHFGMAKAYAHLGDMRRAAEALVQARDTAGNQRDRYQAKLDLLRRLHPRLRAGAIDERIDGGVAGQETSCLAMRACSSSNARGKRVL